MVGIPNHQLVEPVLLAVPALLLWGRVASACCPKNSERWRCGPAGGSCGNAPGGAAEAPTQTPWPLNRLLYSAVNRRRPAALHSSPEHSCHAPSRPRAHSRRPAAQASRKAAAEQGDHLVAAACLPKPAASQRRHAARPCSSFASPARAPALHPSLQRDTPWQP